MSFILIMSKTQVDRNNKWSGEKYPNETPGRGA